MNPAREVFSSDVGLARRLEGAEAAGVRRFATCAPGAEFLNICGGCAVFAGVGGFATQAIGLGMNGVVTADELDTVERFYRQRGSPSMINICPLADFSFIELIMARPYRIREIENLMVRPVTEVETPSAARRILDGEVTDWARVIAQGFSGLEDPPPEFGQALSPTAMVSQCYASYDEGRIVAGGAMNIEDGIALFYGDATLAAYRGRGFQQAIIQARLARAYECRSDYAMATVVPGSGSHRNYERQGFRLFYTRVNVRRDFE